MRLLPRRQRATASTPVVTKGYSVIDAHTSITGDIETTGSVRVDGKLDGSVLRADTVVIGVGATMSGDVHAREVLVGGTLTGAIRASERVELQATAVVSGDVQTVTVLIEEGGVVNGSVLMGASAPAVVGRPMAHEPPEPARK